MTLEVRVDQDACISSGRCVADYPSAFHFDDEEISQPTEGAGTLSDQEKVDAAHGCPSGAIQLFKAGVAISVD